MQNKPFTRIDNRLVMVMERPPDFIGADGFFKLDNSKRVNEWKNRPSYPINPADLDKFEFGKQYWEGKDFVAMKAERYHNHFTAFPLPTPNDRIEKGELNGECNRAACDNKNAIYFNKSTKAYYCKDCADLINKYNVADTVRLYGVPYLCEAVTTNKNDRREEKQKEESDWKVWRELFDDIFEAINKATPYEAYQTLSPKYIISKADENQDDLWLDVCASVCSNDNHPIEELKSKFTISKINHTKPKVIAETQNMVTAEFAYKIADAFRREAENNKSESKTIERMTEMCIESLDPKLFEQFENIVAELKKNRNQLNNAK